MLSCFCQRRMNIYFEVIKNKVNHSIENFCPLKMNPKFPSHIMKKKWTDCFTQNFCKLRQKMHFLNHSLYSILGKIPVIYPYELEIDELDDMIMLNIFISFYLLQLYPRVIRSEDWTQHLTLVKTFGLSMLYS